MMSRDAKVVSMYPARVAGKHVILREFTAADLDGVFAVVGDDRVTRWLSFDSRSRAEAEEMLTGITRRARADPRTEYYFAIALPGGEDQVAGFCRLGLAGVEAAKLGYAIRPEFQGCGYATDAVRAMVSFAFSELGLHRVSAAIGPHNAPSLAIMPALGFSYEGRIRDHVRSNGAWRDSELYSVLQHEWPPECRSRPMPDGETTAPA
jgi:ribosomal-protein-alanine N-acetyltransferase